jgi:hypothetical protein
MGDPISSGLAVGGAGPVEAFDVGALVGLARLDEAHFDVLAAASGGEGLAGQLGAVVAANRLRPAVQIDELGYVSPARFLAGWISSQHDQAVAA